MTIQTNRLVIAERMYNQNLDEMARWRRLYHLAATTADQTVAAAKIAHFAARAARFEAMLMHAAQEMNQC